MHQCELSSKEIASIIAMRDELQERIEQAKLERSGYWYLDFRDGDTAHQPEILQELVQLWQKGSAFYLTCVVNAPYSGCFHEPQIYLVTPPTSSEAFELRGHWRLSRWDPVVWPLYASGHGVFVDCIKSCEDVARWITDQSLWDLAIREPADKLGTRRHFANWEGPPSNAHGSFDSFSLHKMQPINQLPPAEHYWASAVQAASREYGIELAWTCDKCGRAQHGSGEGEQEPVFTSYRGNGGIGVFMEGAMCMDCVEEGLCKRCRERGGGYSEVYDPDVAEYRWDLCEWCTEELAKGLQLSWEGEPVDLPETVFLYRNGEKSYGFYDEDGSQPYPISIAHDVLDAVDTLRSSYLDDPFWGYNCDDDRRGLQLPGRAIENSTEESSD